MKKKRFNLVERNEVAEKSFECIWTEEGKPGLDYFLNRGISKDTIRLFHLGYIPKFVNHQLRGRIIFPIYDPSGNLIVLSSRSISDEDSFLPVYWHESYEKDFYLYGIHLAKKAMRQFGFVLVCEGQFDLLQLFNYGVQNAVAICGTKLSNVHVATIQRYCDEIVLLLDTDDNQAGQRGIQKALEANKVELNGSFNFPCPFASGTSVASVLTRKIYSVPFDENCDPDEYIRKYGINSLKERIRRRRNEFHSSGT